MEEAWIGNPSLPVLDMMMGDLNMVESSLDCYPTCSDNAAMVMALEVFQNRHELIDG
jgi:hypothetical protein